MAAPPPNPFARMLDTNKLKGAENFADWYMDLRIVLNSEKLGYILDGPLPLAISPDALPEEHETFQQWKDDDLRVKSFILSSLSSELKKTYWEMHDAYSMMTQLRESFMNQEQVVVHKVSMELFHSRLDEGQAVSPHVLHLIDLIEQLRRQDFPLNETLGRTVILGSLPASYRQFVMYFNMNGIHCSYRELHRMLLTAEEDLRKGVPTRPPKPTSLSASSQSKSKGKKSKGKKKNGFNIPPQGKTAKPKRASEDKCHHCQKVGHWKRNCPDYLAQLRKERASTSGTFIFPIIDISLACEAITSNWILDSACPIHICNTLQVLTGSRRLKSREMQLRFGSGDSLDAVVVVLCEIPLPNESLLLHD